MEALDLGTTLGRGETPGRRQVRLFDLQGSHYEMGYQQGLQMREAIHHFFDHLRDLETFRRKRPFFLPFRTHVVMAAKRAFREAAQDLYDYYPRQKARMEGIAKGAGISEHLLFLALAAETFLAEADYRLGSCTAAGLTPERSALGEPVVIKNFDHPEFFQPYYVSRLNRSAETASTLDVTMAPLAGCHDGINEHGLCISCNSGHGTDLPTCSIPVSVLVQEALENCATTEEAVSFLRAGKRSGGAILLVADAEGEMATVELSPNFSGVREPEQGVLINTNHYRCREMISYDIPHNAFYTTRNVRALRGVRVHESSEMRYARVEQLFSETEVFSLKDLLRVFSDHGESGRGDDNTVCRHGPYFTTTCSLIMLPRSRRVLVTYGHPCESVFTDFLNPFASEEGSGEGRAE
ncbi:C45 family autoproteolytic acyltransferase/hydolase [Candidatus Solincola sp.]|nr:C45 family autoproteolytic acyltransferase/hydrolase [Actinomycetota bacterium]MDI7251808.1 C45 family autoproteolytic acyltransferase/hydrolase [Actinomycetota bacterium]